MIICSLRVDFGALGINATIINKTKSQIVKVQLMDREEFENTLFNLISEYKIQEVYVNRGVPIEEEYVKKFKNTTFIFDN